MPMPMGVPVVPSLEQLDNEMQRIAEHQDTPPPSPAPLNSARQKAFNDVLIALEALRKLLD